MTEEQKKVSLDEAMEQVRIVGIRLALMHLAYARTIVRQLGPEQGRDLIVKAMMAYGKLVGERQKSGKQDLPWYGFHDRYVYEDNCFVDTREQPAEDFDYARYKVFGCVLAKTFLEYGEPELGALYCFVDPAKSMTADHAYKLIHTACEVCGDECCAFDKLPTSEEERQEFASQDSRWQKVDPILTEKAKGKGPGAHSKDKG